MRFKVFTIPDDDVVGITLIVNGYNNSEQMLCVRLH